MMDAEVQSGGLQTLETHTTGTLTERWGGAGWFALSASGVSFRARLCRFRLNMTNEYDIYMICIWNRFDRHFI
jgi:hypothetical protein